MLPLFAPYANVVALYYNISDIVSQKKKVTYLDLLVDQGMSGIEFVAMHVEWGLMERVDIIM